MIWSFGVLALVGSVGLSTLILAGHVADRQRAKQIARNRARVLNPYLSDTQPNIIGIVLVLVVGLLALAWLFGGRL